MDPSKFNLFGFDPNAYYAMVAQQQQAEQPDEAAPGVFEQHLEEAAQPDAPDYGRRYRATPEDQDLIDRAGHAAPSRTISDASLVKTERVSACYLKGFTTITGCLSLSARRRFAEDLCPATVPG
ncbi:MULTISPECIES: hypothetical protein [unclassified Bradyrhizobium]|uniref:hypothetical protein n=1 Tax=unclassified Bradyrhizobium TaxID=2631580 RepID=UPI0020B3DC45|nr:MULTISPECIES: hypothetical protein [unclassified Bradyrhizobium]MCP3380118.1 hypothetical protein [Bradyrhizobium sp. CCGUVB4N]MCP3440988.1 hypothetical protein [Bradyrhizobium sp. CCGUVB14]